MVRNRAARRWHAEACPGISLIRMDQLPMGFVPDSPVDLPHGGRGDMRVFHLVFILRRRRESFAFLNHAACATAE